MHVAGLGRFPVKSMAGEPLGRADVRPDGIVGDRVAYVLGAHGRIVTARTRPWLVGHRATLGTASPKWTGVRGAVIGVQDLRQRCIMTTVESRYARAGHRRAAPHQPGVRRAAGAELLRG